MVAAIAYTKVAGNSAKTAGGGVNVKQSGSALLRECVFIGNTAGSDWYFGNVTTELPFAPLLWNMSNTTRFVPSFGVVEPTSLEPVSWPVRGGGARVEETTGLATVLLCTFQSNNALSAGLGGGLYSRNKEYLLSELTVTGNYADGFGGGIYDTVGVLATDSHPRFAQLVEWCNITKNTARGGGGGLFWVHSETFRLASRNVIVDNNALWGPQKASMQTVRVAGKTLAICVRQQVCFQRLDAPDIDPEVYQATSGHLYDIDIVVNVVDHYDQIVKTDSGTRVWAGASNIATFLMGHTTNLTLHGVATFTELGLIAPPDNSYVQCAQCTMKCQE